MWFLQDLEAKLSCESNHNKVGLISINYIWFFFYQFQQARNEEYQSLKKWSNAVITGSNGTVARTVVKFTTLDDFAMIANFRYHSEKYYA